LYLCIGVYLGKDEDVRERDQMRMERHKERARDRNLARAAPDKRYVPILLLRDSSFIYYHLIVPTV